MAPHHYNNLPAMFRLANGGVFLPVIRWRAFPAPSPGPVLDPMNSMFCARCATVTMGFLPPWR